MKDKKTDCFIADLTHTSQGIQAKCFPLGTGLVAEYAKQELGDILNIKLYKYPDELEKAIAKIKPRILALSNYAWNQELGITFAKAYKEFNKDAIIVMGGPNFPSSEREKKDFLVQYNVIDFYIFGEGEVAFVNLLKIIIDHDYCVDGIKAKMKSIDNCSYIYNDQVYSGDYLRIKNIQEMPSPYLNGTFDEYFKQDLIPLYETTRGCPFSCTYCCDGIKDKSKVFRHTQENINRNLEYIAINRKHGDSLTISDLDFGMYSEDIITCEKIADMKKKYNFPIFFAASAGKSKFKNILKCVKILDGSWTVGASVQSTDTEVLKAIKRKNLPLDKLLELANISKDSGAVTYTEVILALPKDTKEKHFKSLEVGVDAGLNSLKMYQLMLLTGTEMSSNCSIEQHDMTIKYRVMPGAAGIYNFFGIDFKIAEFEKIVVATETLSYADYIECRVMNLFIEIFINNAMFDEFYSVLEMCNVSKFDVIKYIYNNDNLYTLKVQKIIDSFKKDTQKGLFDTYKEILDYVKEDNIIQRHIAGELGNNELLDHKALSYINYSEFMELLYTAIVNMLKNKNTFTAEIDEILNELKEFIITKNGNFKDTSLVIEKTFRHDFSNISSKSFKDIINSKNAGIKYKFYHTNNQKSIIESLCKMYNGNSVAGLGRLIQRSNLNVLYRKFSMDNK